MSFGNASDFPPAKDPEFFLKIENKPPATPNRGYFELYS